MGSIDGIFLFARSARDVVGAQRLVELVDYRLAKPGEWKDLEDPPEALASLKAYVCFYLLYLAAHA